MEVSMRIKTNDKYKAIPPPLCSNIKKIKDEIVLGATLNIVYFNKKSDQTINVKMNHQLTSMETTIHQINPKFHEKSKNYDKVKQEMIETLDIYEKALKQLADKYDEELKQMIYEKVKLESKLLVEIVQSLQSEGEQQKQRIFQLEKKIKKLSKKIQNLDTEKINKIFQAMEVGGKDLSVTLKKPRKITKITTFFSNRFNTYQVILKSLILPMKQRIDEFKVNELKRVDEGKVKELDLNKVQDKIKSIQNKVLETLKNESI